MDLLLVGWRQGPEQSRKETEERGRAQTGHNVKAFAKPMDKTRNRTLNL